MVKPLRNAQMGSMANNNKMMASVGNPNGLQITAKSANLLAPCKPTEAKPCATDKPRIRSHSVWVMGCPYICATKTVATAKYMMGADRTKTVAKGTRNATFSWLKPNRADKVSIIWGMHTEECSPEAIEILRVGSKEESTPRPLASERNFKITNEMRHSKKVTVKKVIKKWTITTKASEPTCEHIWDATIKITNGKAKLQR